jgi:hypothetical protein
VNPAACRTRLFAEQQILVERWIVEIEATSLHETP